MSDIAIKVSNISKRYRIGLKEELHDTFSGAVASFIFSPFNNLRRLRSLSRFDEDVSEDIVWALRDVSFEVKHGEVLGIIGKNGAGKSTLLKILARVTSPTSGKVVINGRIASLLEVGTGFHPELTGRENVFLNGTILGMTKAEIQSKFDEIVDFSGIEKFIDTPVKRYSSGMRVRLAFAVAAHLEPEILLIDEVLAVGDTEFQKKCIGKMGDIAGQGRTVLFVSHNMTALRSLCSRATLLENGRVALNGNTETTVNQYLMSTATSLPASIDTIKAPRPASVTNFWLRITNVLIENNRSQAIFFSNDPLNIVLEFAIFESIKNVVFGWAVHSVDNVRLFECRSIEKFGVIPVLNPGQYIIRTSLAENVFNPGIFHLHVGARCDRGNLDYIPNVLSFQVEAAEKRESLWLEEITGPIHVSSEWAYPERKCSRKV